MGDEVEVELVRSGKRRTVDVEIGELEESRPRAQRAERTGLSGFGLRVDDLSPVLRQRYRIETNEGVVVTEVDPSGPAAAAGIHQGDVILEANREPVGSAAELARVLADEDSALVLVTRGETTLYVALKRGK